MSLLFVLSEYSHATTCELVNSYQQVRHVDSILSAAWTKACKFHPSSGARTPHCAGTEHPQRMGRLLCSMLSKRLPGLCGVEIWLGSTRRTPRIQGAIKKGRVLRVAWSSIRSFVAPSALQEYGTAYGVSLRNANVTTSFHFRTGGCRVQHEMVGRNTYSSLPVPRSPKWFSRELWRTTLSRSIPINRDRLGYSHHCDIWGAYPGLRPDSTACLIFECQPGKLYSSS